MEIIFVKKINIKRIVGIGLPSLEEVVEQTDRRQWQHSQEMANCRLAGCQNIQKDANLFHRT